MIVELIITGEGLGSEIFATDLNFVNYIQGSSAYDIAVEHGFKGSQEDYLLSLRQPAIKAASEATAAAQAATTAISLATTATEKATSATEKAMSAAELAAQAKKLLFIDMWNSRAGTYGKYNAKTGFFELNEITDIGYEEAMQIYSASVDSIGLSGAHNLYRHITTYGYPSIRTLFAPKSYPNNPICENMFARNTFTTLVAISNPTGNRNYCYYFCDKLKKIIGITDVSQIVDMLVLTFYMCKELESINIFGLMRTVSFSDSPKLSKESILYMIQNAINATTITITLHATAYAMAMSDTEIKAALTTKGNINLASA